MTRAIETTRTVVVGMILAGAALGIFGGTVAAISPHVPGTEQTRTTHVREDSTAAERDVLTIARERSGETDPCIPIAPVTFVTQIPVAC